MHGTISIDEKTASENGWKTGDVINLGVLLDAYRVSIIGNSHQRRIARRANKRRTILVPTTVSVLPANAELSCGESGNAA